MNGRSGASRPIRLCVVTTVGSSIQVLYRGRLEYFAAHGFDITVVCASSELDDAIRARGVCLHTAPLTRHITPWADLRALWNLWRFFRREHFDLVEVGTPKAALVGSLAARLARVPCLIHLLHGLAYQGQRGLVGRIVRLSTSLPCRLAHENVSVSPSAREEAHRDGVCDRDRMRVLGSGSCNGVDLQRFSPQRRRLGQEVRARHSIPEDAVVVGFLGRMTRDKGMVELVAAARTLFADHANLRLLLVGDYENRDRPPADVMDFVRTQPGVCHVGWQADPVPYLAAMDIVVLPSHREGLPGVLLEAAAMGLPAVTTNATGCRDVVQHIETGLQVPVGDPQRLRAAIQRLAGDTELRRRMGVAARRHVEEHFDQNQVWESGVAEYRRLASR